MRVRLKMRDGGGLSRARVRDGGETAEKTKVAVYTGAHYVAERDGEDLVIYSIGVEGKPGVRTGTGDKRARDAFREIDAGLAATTAVNKAADDFWAEQRAAQNAAFK